MSVSYDAPDGLGRWSEAAGLSIPVQSGGADGFHERACQTEVHRDARFAARSVRVLTGRAKDGPEEAGVAVRTSEADGIAAGAGAPSG